MLLNSIRFDATSAGGLEAFFSGGERCDEGIRIREGESADFASFFNGLDADFLNRCTNVREVALRLEYSGRAKVSVRRYKYKAKKKGKRAIYRTDEYMGCIRENGCELKMGTTFGFLGFSIEALTEVVFRSGGWHCADECRTNEVRIGFVICAYGREAETRENARRIRDAFGADANVYVVDNGRTLKESDLPEGAKLIPSRNFGASGGFSRGMIECAEDGMTHCVLMDDDIIFDPETPRRTKAYLETLNERYAGLVMGAAMFSTRCPTLIYEMGGYAGKTRLRSPKRNIEVSKPEGLLRCLANDRINYTGWYYSVVPVPAIERAGLAMPFFIRYDDAEFGYRLSRRHSICFPIGLGVYHGEFHDNPSPRLEYYSRRNDLISSAIVREGGARRAFLKLWGSVALLRKDRMAVTYALKGYADYFKGPEFLADLDLDAFDAEIRAMREKPLSGPAAFFAAIGFSLRLAFRMRGLNRRYRERMPALTSKESWAKRFESEPALGAGPTAASSADGPLRATSAGPAPGARSSADAPAIGEERAEFPGMPDDDAQRANARVADGGCASEEIGRGNEDRD